MKSGSRWTLLTRGSHHLLNPPNGLLHLRHRRRPAPPRRLVYHLQAPSREHAQEVSVSELVCVYGMWFEGSDAVGLYCDEFIVLRRGSFGSNFWNDGWMMGERPCVPTYLSTLLHQQNCILHQLRRDHPSHRSSR